MEKPNYIRYVELNKRKQERAAAETVMASWMTDSEAVSKEVLTKAMLFAINDMHTMQACEDILG
ncbi:hypothetical protein [Butyrivibrio sp. INlla21]|uniref:hypothetical protein n=1 Tax=Butyrivibrio sp. INlla21 TaxID=1520811 RepID=UPI0008E95D8B|nr:hypothetical protein [Butyrivibrio sp. INlla21]SFU57492.1 hypothetical protein SAMN02910342_00948 [Butyrivibrio sp. INlla21]